MKCLQSGQESAILTVRNEYLICPFCGNKRLLHINADTEATALPVYCRKCSREILINVHRGQCSRSQSPG